VAMYPGTFAETTPDKPAVIMAGTEDLLTFKQLDDRSNQLAQLLWEGGLREGDHVAILMENRLEYFVCFWAAVRSGLYITAINRYLQPDESSYIVNDSGSRALFASAAMAELVAPIPALSPDLEILLSVGGGVEGFDDFDTAVDRYPAQRLERQPRGESMLYSSGTTGRPKGIKRPLSGIEIDDPAGMGGVALLLTGLFGATADAVYLSPAPLYHSAPLGFTTSFQSLGATVVVMPRQALQAGETYCFSVTSRGEQVSSCFAVDPNA